MKTGIDCKNWNQFVNLYRQYWGTNEGLERAQELTEMDLERHIYSLKSYIGG